MSSADSTSKKSTIDSIIKSKLPALGVDLGGTKILAAPIIDLKIVGEPRQVATPHGPDNIINAILDLANSFQKDSVLAGIGVATAGIVDTKTGEVIGSTGNLPGWAGTPLKTIIENKTMLPTHVENDANAAAYGESRARKFDDYECVVVVTLGTGIGGGIMCDGKLYRGAHYAAGEVGHMRISMENKRLCTCGLFDCWEAYGSGRGLLMTGKEVLQGISPEQSELARDIEALDTRKLITASRNDDIIAKKAMKLWHEHLAVGLVTLAHTFDPNCFVLSGGLSEFVDYELLEELVADRSLPTISKNLDIHKSELEGNAGIIGAAQLILDDLGVVAQNKG